MKKNLPSPFGAVRAGQLAGEDSYLYATLVKVIGDRQDILDRAAEAVEFPHGEGVAWPQVVHCGCQPRTNGAAGGDLLFEDPATACGGERIVLQLGILKIGGDAGEPDEIVVGSCHATNRLTTHLKTLDV